MRLFEFLTLRAELEYAYTDTRGKDDDDGGTKIRMRNSTLMLNGYADVGDASWMIKPYVGAGLGYGFANHWTWDYSPEWKLSLGSGFAYAGMIGAAWYINPNIAIDLGFKYAVITNLDDNGQYWSTGTNYKGTEAVNRTVTLGARYTF